MVLALMSTPLLSSCSYSPHSVRSLKPSQQLTRNSPEFQAFKKTKEPPFGNTKTNINKLKANPPKENFKFILLGDNRNPHPFSKKGDRVYKRVIKKINQLKPDFAISDGDFTFDNLWMHWRDFERMTSKIKVPFLTAVGNHDIIYRRTHYETRYTPPNSETGLDDYSFEYNNTRFVVLDTANRNITERQFTWLNKQTNTPQKTVVISHMPPIYGNWHHKLSPSPEVSKRWMNLMSKNKVDYVLLGHIHLYDEEKVNGVQYIVSGGAGAPLKTKLGYGTPVHHVVEFNVTPTNISHKMIPIESADIYENPSVQTKRVFARR